MGFKWNDKILNKNIRRTTGDLDISYIIKKIWKTIRQQEEKLEIKLLKIDSVWSEKVQRETCNKVDR